MQTFVFLVFPQLFLNFTFFYIFDDFSFLYTIIIVEKNYAAIYLSRSKDFPTQIAHSFYCDLHKRKWKIGLLLSVCFDFNIVFRHTYI